MGKSPRTERTPEEKKEVGAFINRLLEHSPFANWSDFARAAGLYSSNVSEYQNGLVMPDGWTLYRLIRAAAKAAEVEPEVTAVAAGPHAQRDLLDRLQSLEDSVKVTRTLVAEALGLQERARELEAELQRPQEDQDHPAAADGTGGP